MSPLQQRIATLLTDLPEAEGFALAGGAALIIHGVVERTTRDLDFFGLEPEMVQRFAPAAERVLRADGLTVQRVLDGPAFTRLVVTSDTDRTEVDLGTDARLFPLEDGLDFRVLSTEELAVDKVLAVFGRAEARDFMDLMALEARFGLERLARLASEKDRGFDLTTFAEMAGRFARLRRDEFSLDDEQYVRLAEVVAGWRIRSLELAQRLGQERSPGNERGGFGLEP